jgi:SAM-dependent methyltransferase
MSKIHSPIPDNPYDVVPYSSYPYPQTHPGRLATIAQLFSLPAPPLETMRVLEIGCASGGNIIPLACTYPQAEIIGVDYSRVQIDDGLELVRALGLKNIDLRCADLMQVDESWGRFDYVICHGVYSWVAPTLQNKILSIAEELLAPHGIAYVSYNAYPGWHMRGVVRHMMRYHAMRYTNPFQRIAEARRVLEMVMQHALGGKDSPYHLLLNQEAELLAKCGDQYIYHEHLEENCEPLYFHEFVERARQHGLDYLGEPRLGSMTPSNFGGDAYQALRSLARDPIELEQFMDYFSNRMFRETLLHRAGRNPKYELQPELVFPMYVSGAGRANEKAVDFTKGVQVTFTSRHDVPLTTPMPLLKAAIVELTNHWPAAMHFDELFAACCKRLSLEGTSFERTQLARSLLVVLTTSDSIELSTGPTHFTVTPGDKPFASPLARAQAETQSFVTTGRHEMVQLTPEDRRTIHALDGSNDVTAIAKMTKTSNEVARVQIERFARMALVLSGPRRH